LMEKSRFFQCAICTLAIVALIIGCRIMDYRYQTMSEQFPIETCVQVDLVRGEIGYVQSTRCTLVVKAFKAGRQSAMVLKTQ